MSSPFKVLLIATNAEREPFPVYPLGASLVATALERAGVEVRALDLAFADNPAERSASAAVETEPDLIAISIRAIDNTTYLDSRDYLPAVEAIVGAVRCAAGAPLLIGGSGFSIMPEAMLERMEGDYGIQGEGERAIVQLVQALASGSEPEPGNGLYVRRDHEVLGAPVAGFLPPADWSSPAYHLFPLEPHLKAGGTAAIQTKRGCAQKCCYCTYPILEGCGMRLREPRAVVRDVDQAAEAGADYFYFVDNTFNLPPEHSRAICRELAWREDKPPWTAFITPLAFPAAMAGEMALAGCRSAELGSEAGTAETLHAIGKSHTVADIAGADQALFEAGVTPAHYFIFGGPGETMDSLERTLELIDSLRGVTAATLGLRIYPGTALHPRAIRESVLDAKRDLLEPTFYISPAVDPDQVLARLERFAADHPRFFINGLQVNVNQPVIDRLRAKGRKGPLWEFYSLAR
jgi:radical SAM superfamily enzyme YgiQ (UPF0313 family)